MTPRITLALLCLAAGPLPVLAQAGPATPVHRVSLDTEISHLDRGLPDWRASTLRVSRQTGSRQLLEAELTETRRFGLTDTEAALGGALPLGEALTAQLRVAHSPTHRVLARDSLAAGLQYEFTRGWLLHGGAKRTRYDATDVRQTTLMLEHYFGPFSAAAAVHAARALGQTTEAYELRAAWYYADRSSLTLYASTGDEAAATGPGTITLARVRSLALAGRHALDSRWSLTYGLHRIRQGAFYTRSGASLGVQVAF